MCYWAVNRVYYYPGATKYDWSLNGYSVIKNSVYCGQIDPQEYGNGYGVIRRNTSGGQYDGNGKIVSGSRSINTYSYSAAPSHNGFIMTTRGCNTTYYYPGAQGSSMYSPITFVNGYLRSLSNTSVDGSNQYGYHTVIPISGSESADYPGYSPGRNVSGGHWGSNGNYLNQKHNGSRSLLAVTSLATSMNVSVYNGQMTMTFTSRGCNKRRNLHLHILSWGRLMSNTTNGYWMEGYSYTVSTVPTVDPQSYGQIRGVIRRNCFGGDYNISSYCGTRSSWCQNGTIGVDNFTASTIGATRGCKGTHNQSYYPGADGNREHFYYPWYTAGVSVYNSSIDSQNYGYSLGVLRRNMTGGTWDANSQSNTGSRSLGADSFSARLLDYSATRGCNKAAHLRVLSWRYFHI